MYLNQESKNSFRILKGGKISLVVSGLLISTTISFAAPSDGVVTSGNANISQSGNTTNINQSSNKASINWNKFDIASNETVNFNQPNSSSITLNRVVGNEKSIISGALNANGQVWILNSNGVLFNSTASINTSGILATTAELSDTDFNAGNYNFKNSSKNSVINLGTIEVANSGYVVLASNEVKNEGTIKAVKGKVHLVGANEYTLNLNGNSIVNLIVNKGVLDSMVENSGTIIADGGEVYLTTNAVNELLKGVVNNTGIIEANSLDGLMGKVEVFAHGGEVQVGGTIEAQDGFVETSGDKVKIDYNFKVTADKWLIDPVDFTIAASGGDMSGTTLSNNLATTDVEIKSVNGSSGTKGDINVNDTVTWSTNNTLTLNAQNNININSAITATSGKLALHYGQANVNSGNESTYNVNAKVNLSAGSNFITKLGSNGAVTPWTVVTDSTSMQNFTLNDSTKYYVLGTDLTLSGTNNWTPIGGSLSTFQGNFDGLGHTISNLNINRPTENYVGLFGYTNGATIQNIGLVNINVIGENYVGGLVGNNNGSTITNSYASGAVTGTTNVGGLVGINETSSYTKITNSYATGVVTGTDSVGGLVGWNRKEIINSYASGTVTGTTNVGGLTGNNDAAFVITNSFYDIDTNTTMSHTNLGKTKLELLALTKGVWKDTQWIARGNDIEGYTTDIFTLPVLKTFYTPTATLFNSGYGTALNPYTITNWTQLQNINNSNILTKDYYFDLSNSIDSSTSDYTNLASSTANSGAGWNPLGNSTNRFKGTFDGLGSTISDLYINRPTTDYIGLFGFTSGSNIKNIGLVNINVIGRDYVGGLVGWNNNISTITNSYASGTVTGTGTVFGIGGLVGNNSTSTIENSYASGTVTGTGSGSGSGIGGLVGGNFTNATITNSYATGTVTGTGIVSSIGGLVGVNNATSTITNSYATGTVTGSTSVGGLVGINSSTTITNSFYDSTKNPTSVTNAGVTGKTTEELSYGKTFKDASWDIVADSSVTSLTPVLKYNSTTSLYYWAIAPLEVTYTLSDESKTYDGVTQNLNDLYTNVITTNADLVGSAYKFQVNNIDVTGYKDAGTYENIKVALDGTNDFLAIASSGNTDGKYVIKQKTVTPTPTPTPEPVVEPETPTGPTAEEIAAEAARLAAIEAARIAAEQEAARLAAEEIIKAVENVIASIVNTNVLKIPQTNIKPPKIVVITVPATVFNSIGGNLVSKPLANQQIKVVTMTELKALNNGSNPLGNNDIRVPVGENSIIMLVNGGVNLPNGVDQQFFVINDENNI